jgi:hypothetical protein
MLNYLAERNFIHGSSMFKRQAFLSAGGYISSDDPEDYNLFKRIIAAGYDVKKVTNTNLEYRQHSAEQANNVSSLYQQLKLYRKLHIERTSFERTKYYKLGRLLYKAKSMSFKAIVKAAYRRIFK